MLLDDFEALYHQFQPDVYRFLFRLTGYEQLTAEELTQETFYQAFLSFSKFRGECAMRTWLFQIAKNVYGKYIRRETRQRTLAGQQNPETLPPPGEELEQSEILKTMRKLIQELDEPARSVVQYRLYSGTGYAEIARLLHIKSNTAAVIYNRTIARLRKILKERYDYEI